MTDAEYRRWWPVAVGTAWKRLWAIPTAFRHDAAADAATDALLATLAIEPVGSAGFPGLLAKAAREAAHDRYRYYRRRRRDGEIPRGSVPVVRLVHPSTALERADLLEHLTRGHPDVWAVVRARLEGYTGREIGAALGLGPRWAANVLSLARPELSRRWEVLRA